LTELSSPTSAPLVIENLSFRYHSRKELAIQNINLEVQTGEILLIAGASGCGKTTVARCVNGLIPRSYRGDRSGQVLLDGREVSSMALADVSQVVGTLLQDPERQIVSSHVIGEIAFGPENLGLARDEIYARVDEVCARLRIEHLRGRETFHLSGGEKQKVALAGVLAMHPSILLLDEPLASLDPASAHEALEIFRRLADEGTTILLIEHRVEDALVVRPDRLLYMEAGEIRYLGPVSELPTEIDFRQVKLPASWVIKRVQQELAGQVPKPSREAAVLREGGEEGFRQDSPAVLSRPVVDPHTQPTVVFENVSFAYESDSPEILHNINLEIRKGDLIAILGPNGAGKSTMVKHAIGLLKPSRGRVLVNSKDSRQISVAQTARTVGYVFQSPTHMLFAPTVREELAFGPSNLGYSQEVIQENVSNSITAVNLTGLEEYPPLGLSFGQQKRTTIAAVVAMQSRILVMDEPTAGQDYANYTRFMNALLGATVEGGDSILTAHFDATLFITHDVDLAVTYANRVILLRAGQIAADGPPEETLCDFARLEACRIRPTSLLDLNCRLLPDTGRFYPAERLAFI
jgi:energy-coupling factor transport system ATP-binding protein